jgi:hypothetical protein
MHATVHIFARCELSFPFIKVSDPQPLHPKRRGSRRPNAPWMLYVPVWRSCLSGRLRSVRSTKGHLQPGPLRMVQRVPAQGRLFRLGRASLHRCRKSPRPCGCRALLVAGALYLTNAIADLISFASVVFSIVCVIGLAARQSSAQQVSGVHASLSTDNQIFQTIEDRWGEAIKKRNQYALEQLLSPELIDISAIGAVTTRNQQIAMLFGKDTEPLSLDQRVSNVRTFGDLAVVIGTYGEKRRVNGKLMGLNGMFTHVFQNVHGNWLCVSAQRTLPVETVPEKGRIREK